MKFYQRGLSLLLALSLSLGLLSQAMAATISYTGTVNADQVFFRMKSGTSKERKPAGGRNLSLWGFLFFPADSMGTLIRAGREGDQTMNPAEIFTISDPSSFGGQIYDRLSQIAEYGEKLSNLNEVERTVYFVEELQAEVMNGGFEQYFFNSSGDHWEEAIAACEAIGAVKTAALLRQAVRALGCDLPKDRETREAAIEEHAKDGYEAALAALDAVFYDYEENVDALVYQYCQRNQNHFFF